MEDTIKEKGMSDSRLTDVWFTADTHFGHTNIIKYCNRPFKSAGEMDAAIIANWNAVIGPNDMVYHLGDFCFGNRDFVFDSLFSRLSGNICFIKGNHDKLTWNNKHRFHSYADSYKEIVVNNKSITLSHYPILTWNKKHHGAIMLHGHSHYNIAATRKDGISLGKILDVGVDGNDFKPYHIDEILKIMEKKPMLATNPDLQDHHGTKTELDKLNR